MSSNLIKIVLVDDHLILRDGLRLILSSEHDVQIVGEASDGESAVQLVSELQPDIVIMDRRLLGLDGVSATRQIRAQNANVKIIALASDHCSAFTAEWIRAGASAFVLKASAGSELKTAVRAVLRDEVYLSQLALGAMLSKYIPGGPDERLALSSREFEVLKLVADGRSTKQAARDLNVSVKTIESHRRNMMEKLQLDNVADLTRFAIREGISTL